jgi:hypothetical protein
MRTRAIESEDQFIAKIMAEACWNRRNLDGPHLFGDEAVIAAGPIERVEAAGQK